MEIALIFLGIGLSILVMVILIAWVTQNMNWRENKTAFDVAKANREEWEKHN